MNLKKTKFPPMFGGLLSIEKMLIQNEAGGSLFHIVDGRMISTVFVHFSMDRVTYSLIKSCQVLLLFLLLLLGRLLATRTLGHTWVGVLVFTYLGV